MKFFDIKSLTLLVAIICFTPGLVCADESTESKLDPWRFELKPLYLWFLSMEGDTTMEPSGGDPGGTSSFDEGRLTSAFSIHFEAGKGDWTVFTDYLYGQYTADNISISTSPAQGSNELTMHLGELGVTYRVLEDFWYRVELLGGLRYMYVENKFDFYNDNLATLSAKDNLWDGFGGIRLTGFLNDSISATVRADVGGGSSDLVWNVAAMIDWQFKHWGSAYAGYRVLDYKVSNEALDLNLQAKGPVIGLAFYW